MFLCELQTATFELFVRKMWVNGEMLQYFRGLTISVKFVLVMKIQITVWFFKTIIKKKIESKAMKREIPLVIKTKTMPLSHYFS